MKLPTLVLSVLVAVATLSTSLWQDSQNLNTWKRRKVSTQSVTSSVTLVDATNLSIPLSAGRIYQFQVWAPFTIGSAGGYRFRLVPPTGFTSFAATPRVSNLVNGTSTLSMSYVTNGTTDTTNALTTAGTHLYEAQGIVVVGSTDGTLKLQFAQNSSNATAIQLLGTAWILVRQLN